MLKLGGVFKGRERVINGFGSSFSYLIGYIWMPALSMPKLKSMHSCMQARS